MDFERLIQTVLENAPVVGILLWIAYRSDQRVSRLTSQLIAANERLLAAIVECYEDQFNREERQSKKQATS